MYFCELLHWLLLWWVVRFTSLIAHYIKFLKADIVIVAASHWSGCQRVVENTEQTQHGGYDEEHYGHHRVRVFLSCFVECISCRKMIKYLKICFLKSIHIYIYIYV